MDTPLFRRARLMAVALAATAAALLGGGSARAATYVNRSNQNDPATVADRTIGSQTWTTAGDPYIIEGKLTVQAGATLTVQSGVQVKVSPNKGLYVNGALAASGATFAINGSGNWLGIYLSSASSASTIANCTLSSAGSDTGLGSYHGALRTAAIYVDDCNPTITGTTISASGDDGIELYTSNATIQNCTFSGIQSGDYAILNDTVDCFPVVSGNAASGLGGLGIGLAGGSQFLNGRWRKGGADFPYFLRANLFLSGATLTVDPGVEVQAVDTALYVSTGTLIADGTAAQPIVFTGRGRLSSAGGDWLGIAISSLSGASVLNYCEIRNAGAAAGLGAPGGNRKAALFVDTADVTITNCLIANSETHGIEVISGAGQGGGGPQVSTITGTTFENVKAGYSAIYCDDPTCFLDVAGNSATGAGRLGISLGGGDLDSSGTLKRGGTNFPYFLRNSLTVPFQRTVTVNSGVTMLMDANVQVLVQGTWKADGSVLSPIEFSSSAASPAPGAWAGFFLSTTAGASIFDHCIFRYPTTAVTIGGCDPTISFCTISSTSGHGISVDQSAIVGAGPATITGNAFQDVGIFSYAISYANLYTFPVISGNAAGGTGYHGIRLPGGSVEKFGATYPKPGTDFAYYLTGDITVNASAGLKFGAGNIVRSWGGGILAQGNFQIVGTEDEPVTFTSAQTAPAPGDWKGLFFSPTSDASVMNFVTIAYAGSPLSAPSGTSAVRANGKNVVMDHLNIRFPLGHGIALRANKSAVAACTFEGIAAGFAAVNLETPDTFPSVTGNSATGSGFLGIRVAPGTVIGGQIGTWENGGENFPWFVFGDYTVDSGASLSVAAGAVVKFAGAGLFMNGEFNVNGTPANRTVFTGYGANPAPGGWKGIAIGPTAGFSSIQYADILYGGSDAGLGTVNGVARRAALLANGVPPTLQGCRVLNSKNNGVELYNCAAVVRSSLIAGCVGTGFRLTSNANAQLINSTVSDNGTGVGFTGTAPAVTNGIVAFNGVGVSGPAGSEAKLTFTTFHGNAQGFSGLADVTGQNGNGGADPLFAARGAGNYRLLPQSPAINAGSNAAVPAGAKDMDGFDRIRAATVDRGAHEAAPVLPYTALDTAKALALAAGLSTASPNDMARLNVATGGDSATRVDAADAIRLARKVNGTEANP